MKIITNKNTPYDEPQSLLPSASLQMHLTERKIFEMTVKLVEKYCYEYAMPAELLVLATVSTQGQGVAEESN